MVCSLCQVIGSRNVWPWRTPQGNSVAGSVAGSAAMRKQENRLDRLEQLFLTAYRIIEPGLHVADSTLQFGQVKPAG